MSESLKEFFENRNLVSIIDKMAERYGTTPYQIMTQMTIHEFNFNVAVFVVGRIEEEKAHNAPKTGVTMTSLSSFGINRTIVKGPKKGR